jgi:hypothetical protein
MAFNTANATTPSKNWFRPGLILGVGSLLLVVFLVFFGISNYLKYQAVGVTSENQIDAMYQSNQNNLGQFVLKVKEALGVAKLNNAELERIIRSSLEGRYGSDGQGSQQAMLWVKENYPGQYNPALMANVQQTILAGRTDFEVKQNLLIDRVRVYKNQTEVFWPSLWLRFAGFPRASFKWDTYKPIVADSTKNTFDTKVDTGIEIK